MIIALTELEVLAAEDEARTRNDRAIRGGIHSRKIEERYTEEGAHNLETWEERHRVSDVEGAEVRTTPHPRGHLWLYPRDKVGRYLLVVAINRHRYRLVGWLHSEDAKAPRYWRTPDDGRRPVFKAPAFLIPQRDLRPVRELRS